MRRYIAYLHYVLRHKWFVMLECWKLGLYWRGIVHDLSKFSRAEFVPYAKHFYNKDGSKKESKRDKTGYYKPTDTGDPVFDMAWFNHQKLNDHHWQWWVMPEDIKGVKVLPMPLVAVKEMIADWRGASRAQKVTGSVIDWYKKNGSKMQLHPETRGLVQNMLGLYNIEEK